MKTMKQISMLLFLSVALLSNALLAQSQPAASSGVHLGTSNRYAIGTSDEPVYATEYCEFLNQDSNAAQYRIWSIYYDNAFMNASSWIFQNNRDACIYRRSVDVSSFRYSVISGHENDIIDAVGLVSIQKEFNTWRAAKTAAAAALTSNPTRQELCDYINDKIAGKLDSTWLEKASAIQNRYPNASGLTVGDINKYNSFNSTGNFIGGLVIDGPVDGLEQTLWQQVDELVTHLYGHDGVDSVVQRDSNGQFYTTSTHYAASDEACNNFVQRWGLIFSNQVDASLGFPTGVSKYVILQDEASEDARQSWAEEYPANYNTTSTSITLSDTAVVVDVPVIPNPVVPASSDKSGNKKPHHHRRHRY